MSYHVSTFRLMGDLGLLVLLPTLIAFKAAAAQPPPDALPALSEHKVTSSLDGTLQPLRFWAPDTAQQQSTPLFVFLHSWSGDFRQDNSKWQREAVARGWIYLHPNFRGVNQTPAACGSPLARQDILDAVDFACDRFQVDRTRIYLAGVSGGGHMSMLMAGHHPDRFSAVSAWVGISDLADWYHFHVRDGQPQKYAQMILKSLGAPPQTNAEVDAAYRDRSPVFHLQRATAVPIDIYAGVNDGHTGSVPVRHSLNAFNQIALQHGSQPVSEQEMQQLWQDRQLQTPQPSDRAVDPELGRDILLRRTSRQARVTIFDGGHESLPSAACEWLSRQQRMTSE